MRKWELENVRKNEKMRKSTFNLIKIILKNKKVRVMGEQKMMGLGEKERRMLKSLERESLKAVVLKANLEESQELIERAIKKMRKNWEMKKKER